MSKIYSLLDIPYTFTVVDNALVLSKAAKRKASPGQMSLFGEEPKEGDRKVENGVTYVLKNSRWQRDKAAEKKLKPKSKDGAIAGLGVIQDEPLPVKVGSDPVVEEVVEPDGAVDPLVYEDEWESVKDQYADESPESQAFWRKQYQRRVGDPQWWQQLDRKELVRLMGAARQWWNGASPEERSDLAIAAQASVGKGRKKGYSSSEFSQIPEKDRGRIVNEYARRDFLGQVPRIEKPEQIKAPDIPAPKKTDIPAPVGKPAEINRALVDYLEGDRGIKLAPDLKDKLLRSRIESAYPLDVDTGHTVLMPSSMGREIREWWFKDGRRHRSQNLQQEFASQPGLPLDDYMRGGIGIPAGAKVGYQRGGLAYFVPGQGFVPVALHGKDPEALESVANMLRENRGRLNPDIYDAKLSAIDALTEAALGEAKEGDRRTINGRTYELRNGRWHRVDEEEPGVDPAAEEVQPEPETVEVAEPETVAEESIELVEADDDSTIPPPETKPSPVGEAGKPIDYTGLKDFYSRVRDGSATGDEVRQMWSRFKDSRDFIRAELSKKTKDQLLKEFYIYGGKNETKARLVESCVGALESFFAPGGSFGWSPFTETKEQAIDRQMDQWTDELIQQKAEERKAKTEQTKKAITNPETLEEFRTFLQYRSIEKLTPEQVELYDRLKASEGKSQRQQEEERKAAVQSVELPDGAGLKYKVIKHSKTGEDLHSVSLTNRVDRAAYDTLNQRAKKLGGYYSKYAKAFILPSEDAAQKFISLDGVDGKEQLEQAQAEKQANASDRIREQAERLKEKAEESLSRARLANTARRARMASNAEAGATREKALAETMLNIADGIQEGEVEFLDKLSTKAQFEQLESLLGIAKWDAIRAKQDELKAQGQWVSSDKLERGIIPSDIRYAKYPYPSIHKDTLKTLAQNASSVKGLKQLSDRMMNRWRSLNGENQWQVQFRSQSEIEEYRDFMDKCLKASAKPGSKISDWDVKRNLDDLKDYDRLQRVGITNEAELRTALREYLNFRSKPGGVDPIRKLERELIGLKIDGYFPTPSGLADRVVEMADIRPGMRVLEPSAGKGSIADAVLATGVDRKDLTLIEPVPRLTEVLKAKKYEPVQGDFLEHSGEYDRIVMNPPFENGQDMDHVRHAYELLAPGGKMVAIMSEGPFFRSDKKASSFRDWLDTNGGYSEKLPDGSFKVSDRSTGVSTRLVTITKPYSMTKYAIGGSLYRVAVVDRKLAFALT